MKKLLLLFCLIIPGIIKAQNTVTLETGTSPLTTFQFRYKAITPDSLNHLWLFWNGKYNRMVTMTEADLKYAPAIGGGYVASVLGTANRITSTGGTAPVIDISATFEALLGKVANPLSQFAATTSAQLFSVISDESGSGLVVGNNSPTLITPTADYQTLTGDIFSTAAPSSGQVKIGRSTFVNSFGFMGPNGFAVTFNSTSITGIRALSIPNNGGILYAGSGVVGSIPYSPTIATTASLPIGSTDDILTVTSGFPAWVNFNTSTRTFTNKSIDGLTNTLTNITATTNANLTGPITSVGNATSIASQTGTGSKFVMDTSPTLITPLADYYTANTSIGFISPAAGTISFGRVSGSTFGFKGNGSFVVGITNLQLTADRIYGVPDNVGKFYAGNLTTGGLAYATSTTTTSNLAIGSTDNMLSVVGGLPAWINYDTATRTLTNKTWNGVVIGETYGGAGAVNGIMKANGVGTVSAAVSNTDYLPVTNAVMVTPTLGIASGTNLLLSGTIAAAPTPTGTQVVIAHGNAIANSFVWKGANGFAAAISAVNLTTGRNYLLPDASTTFLGEDNTATITNKSIDGLTNTLTNITASINANLTGPITSVGNATSVASQTGTGSTFVMNTSPVLITPGSDYLKLTGQVSSGVTPTGNDILIGRGFAANTIGFKGANGFQVSIGTVSGATQNSRFFIPDAVGIGMLNPLNTAGDMVYLSANSSTGTNVARLAIGSTDNILSVVGGLPAWVAPSTLTVGNATLAANSTLWASNPFSLAGTLTTGDTFTFDGTNWRNGSVSATAPLRKSGPGVTGTWSIDNAIADGSTRGVASFIAADFNDNGAGIISIDYTNGQAATGSVKGFLTAADFATFAAKAPTVSPTFTTPTLGVASATSLNITGTIGSGFINMVNQTTASIPTPAAGSINIAAGQGGSDFIVKNPAGFFNLLRFTNNTASRTYVYPDNSGSVYAGTFTTGSMPYAASTTTTASLAIGSTDNILTVSSGLPAWRSISALLGYTPANGANYAALAGVNAFTNTNSFIAGTIFANNIKITNGGSSGSINASSTTGVRNASLPDKDGTLAMTSDITNQTVASSDLTALTTDGIKTTYTVGGSVEVLRVGVNMNVTTNLTATIGTVINYYDIHNNVQQITLYIPGGAANTWQLSGTGVLAYQSTDISCFAGTAVSVQTIAVGSGYVYDMNNTIQKLR